MSSKRVKSCCRCGSKKIRVVSMMNGNREVYSIECSSCGRKKSSVYSGDIKYAIRDWNSKNVAAEWTSLVEEERKEEADGGEEERNSQAVPVGDGPG